jgi:hypothetical protein
MSKFDKYRTKPVSKFDKYRTKPVDKLSEEELTNNLSEQELLANGASRFNPFDHKATWGDRAKELGQGLAGGIGSMADLASNYVAAPATFLASKSARGQGKLLKFAGAENAAKMSDKIADDLQNLSNKYGNQNANKEFKEADALKTKNRDTISSMIRGAGEFAPDLIPANLLGKGVRAASTIVHGAAPIAKKVTHGFRNKAAQWLKEPKLPKLANVLETPLTGANLAGFAGAGAGQGFSQKEFDGYLDIPAIMVGAGVGGGLYGAGKGIGKATYNLAKGNNLPFGYKSLAKKINKGNNALDEDFIKATKSSVPETIDEFVTAAKASGHDIDGDFVNLADRMGIETVGDFINFSKEMDVKSVGDFIKATGHAPRRAVELTPFNIYKDNKVPFKIAKNNPVKEYHDVLPKMKHDVYDETNRILDDTFIKFDGNNPKSNINFTNELLKSSLKDAYLQAQEKTTANYAATKKAITAGDYMVPDKTFSTAIQLMKDTDALSHGSSSAGQLHKFLNKFLKEIPEDGKIPLTVIENQRRVINSLRGDKTNGQFNLAKEERDRLQNLKHAIDTDLYESAYNLKTIKDPLWHNKFKHANIQFANQVAPFRESKAFKKLLTGKLNTNVSNMLRDKTSHDDINKLLDIINMQGTFKNAEGKIINPKGAESKIDLAWLKRLETANELFSGKNKNKFSMDALQDVIRNSTRDNPLYQHDLNKLGELRKRSNVKDASTKLNENIRPIIRKYEDLLLKDKKYKAGLSDKYMNPEYYYSKYDVTKHLPHWPTITGGIVGGGLGAVGGPIGYGLGAAGGALISGLAKQAWSGRILKAMNDKQFVNELIRLGRLPKEEKQGMITALLKRPVLKTEIIKSLLLENKKDEKASK